MSIVFSGSGHALPKRVLTNDDLAKIVDTSDEWISSRTGIRSRHIVSEAESLTTLAVDAAKQAIEYADIKISPEQIGLIIVATAEADKSFPTCACEVQAALGAYKAVCFDLSAACSGFIYALFTAECMMKSGGMEYALVIGGDVLSRLLDWTDRSTCVLFGDGVGACLLHATSQEKQGILASSIGADGVRGESLVRSCFGEDRFIHMEGQEVFKFAVRTVPESIEDALQKAGISKDEISCFVLHQANLRIISSVAKKLEVPMEKFPVNLDRVGNTSAGSVGILLDEQIRAGKIRRGDLIVLSGFGAGLTWGSMVVRY